MRAQKPITVSLYDDDGNFVREAVVPMRWEICSACRGEGKRACGGRAFTASEWDEACWDNPDFAEGYWNGDYDRTCEDCGGSGKVQEIDLEAAPEEVQEAWRIQEEVRHEMAAEREAEMRFCYGPNY